jgi:hypothetical protein
VIAVDSRSHRDHLSVVVEDQRMTYFLAGGTSYDERRMLEGGIDGLTADDGVSGTTLPAVRDLARARRSFTCGPTMLNSRCLWLTTAS